jgi:hypothetical protein
MKATWIVLGRLPLEQGKEMRTRGRANKVCVSVMKELRSTLLLKTAKSLSGSKCSEDHAK